MVGFQGNVKNQGYSVILTITISKGFKYIKSVSAKNACIISFLVRMRKGDEMDFGQTRFRFLEVLVW